MRSEHLAYDVVRNHRLLYCMPKYEWNRAKYGTPEDGFMECVNSAAVDVYGRIFNLENGAGEHGGAEESIH